MHWKTLKKILTHSEPPGYRLRQARPKQKLGPYQERIEQILKEDQLLPRKQRHTAKRVWERLKEAGFTGGYTVVKEAVRELTQRSQEVFVPLAHPPHFSTGVYTCQSVESTSLRLVITRLHADRQSKGQPEIHRHQRRFRHALRAGLPVALPIIP